MKRIVLTDRETLRLEEAPVPVPGDEDVVIRVERAGICGSDAHFYRAEYKGTKFPLVLGHEFAGTVHSAGRKAAGFQPGDRVTAEPGIGCGCCDFCKSGAYNLCRSQDFIGGRPGFPGGFAEYVSVPARMVIPLPQEMDFTTGCLVEPVAVAMHCLGRGKIQKGDTVLILGAGAIGLLIAQAVRWGGAEKIIMSDVAPERLALAEKFGANQVIDSGKEDLIRTIQERYGEGGVDVVYDAASVGPTFSQAVHVVKSGGRVINVGEAAKPVELERDLLGREIELTGSRQYTREDFTKALEVISTGEFPLDQVPIRYYPLSQYTEAFDTALNDKAVMRVMFTPQEE